MGGAKMDDKLPRLESLSKYVNDIYIAGGNINSLLKIRNWLFIIFQTPIFAYGNN